jgi:hypothetical protein
MNTSEVDNTEVSFHTADFAVKPLSNRRTARQMLLKQSLQKNLSINPNYQIPLTNPNPIFPTKEQKYLLREGLGNLALFGPKIPDFEENGFLYLRSKNASRSIAANSFRRGKSGQHRASRFLTGRGSGLKT